MAKKKIGVIGLKGLPAYGGAATVGENIINQLKNDYDFTVYSISSHTSRKTGNFSGSKQIVFKKFPIRALNIYYYYFLSVIHCIIKGNYDLIHVHHSDVAIIVPFLKLKYTTIITSHGTIHDTIGSEFKYGKINTMFIIFSEKFIKYADYVTSVSKNLSKKLSSRYSIKVKYIPNGINVHQDDNIIKNIVNNKINHILFGAGRIIPTKGCHILLRALNEIEYKGKVSVIGDTNQNNHYTETLYQISQNLDINYLGLIKDKNKLFSEIKKSELFVYPSSIESMSIMLLEVAACGIPIICSDIIENKDIFNSKEVIFFKTNNIKDLATKINWALDNKKALSKMAYQANNKLRIDYDWNKISRHYSSIYNDVIMK